jgi:DNA-binding response OmpR family regulator
MTLLQSWLESRGYEVKWTSSKKEVSHLVKNFSPGVILIDILQREVAEQLKSAEETQNIPILLMTGYTERLKNTYPLVNDIIEKPFPVGLLEKKIENLIMTNNKITSTPI